MEKKEIQEWRDRLIKMFGIYHSDGQEYITCPLCGINLDELAKHMIEELDKAREEGRESIIAELSISENMEKVERFFHEAPIDYDDKCNLWNGFLSKLKQ